MRIFLVGYMGSGKSTLGARLCKAMGMEFVDLDDYIVEIEGRSVAEIFEKEGEAGFRGIEKRCLQTLIEMRDEVVVSTGGGTPCFYDNMEVMNGAGLTIYLQMDVPGLLFRLENNEDVRPIILGKSPSEMRKFVKQHLEERRHFYEESKMVVESFGFGDKKLEDLVHKIVNYSK